MSGNVAPVSAAMPRAPASAAPAPNPALRERSAAATAPGAAAFRDTLRAQVARAATKAQPDDLPTGGGRVVAPDDGASTSEYANSQPGTAGAPAAAAASGSTPMTAAGADSIHADALWQRLSAGLSAGAATSRPTKSSGNADGRVKGATTNSHVRVSVDSTSIVSNSVLPGAAEPPATDVDAHDSRGNASPTVGGADSGARVIRSASSAEEPGVAVPPADANSSSTLPLVASADGSMAASRSVIAAAPLPGAVDPKSSTAAGPASATPILWSGAVAAEAAAIGTAGTAAATTPSSSGTSRSSLVQALGDRLQVQIARGSESAVIRLDPASMGSIEIAIRHEAGAIQVHLSASNGDVVAQLNAIGESLRQDLNQRHQGEVSVQVSGGARDAHGRQRQSSGGGDEPGRALQEEADDDRYPFALARKGAQA